MKYVVIAAILSVFIIPLPFSVKLLLSFYDKKLYFSIFFFRIIKLKSCYANISDNSVFFHLTDKNAVMFPVSKMFPVKGSFDFFKAFVVTKFNYTTILNAGDSVAAFYILSTINCLNAAAYAYLKETHPLLDFKGDGVISDEKTQNGILADIGICFNVLTVLIMLFKSVLKNIAKGAKNG